MLKKGQVLIEILIAVGVAVIALLSISRLSSRSINNSGSAVRQSTATNYAQTAIDKARFLKNDGGLAAVSNSVFDTGYHCFNGTNIIAALGAYCTITSTEYEGRVYMERATINSKIELSITAEIRWVEGSLTRTVKNEAKMVFDQ